MKKMNQFKKCLVLGMLALSSNIASADEGNVRAGQAGFTQLLINGWGRSSGLGNSNNAGAFGIEAFHMNIAGLGKISSTEIGFSRTSWLGGTGININAFGFGQRVGGDGVLGIAVNSFSIGQIPITTTEQPNGGLGTYKPSISNISLGYAYNFTSDISAGVNFKVVSESTPEIRTGGIAIDAGLQYATKLFQGSQKSRTKYLSSNPAALRESDLRFGVSIKNLGPDLKYSGDGLAVKSNINGNYVTTTSQRADKTQLPSLINIGFGYDFRLDSDSLLYWHRLSALANFTNNSFSSNQTSLGLEYAYKEILMFRTAFDYEKGIFDYDTRRTAYTGLNIGTTVQFALGKKTGKDSKTNNIQRENNSTLGIDYSYRFTNPFSGTHTFGLRVSLD